MSVLNGINVTMFGVLVGTAQIHDDGTMDLNLEPNQFGKDIKAQFEADGGVGTLSITPRGGMDAPQPPQEPEQPAEVSEDIIGTV